MSGIIVEKVISRDDVANLIEYVKSKYESRGQEEFDLEAHALLQLIKKDSYTYRKLTKAIKKYKGKKVVLHISCVNTKSTDSSYKPGDRLAYIVKAKHGAVLGPRAISDINSWVGTNNGYPKHLAFKYSYRKMTFEENNVVLGIIVTPCDFEALAHEIIHFIDYISYERFADNSGHPAKFYTEMLAKDNDVNDDDCALTNVINGIGIDFEKTDISYYYRESEYEPWLNNIIDELFVRAYEMKFKDKMAPYEYAKKAVEMITPPNMFPNIKGQDAEAYYEKLTAPDSMIMVEQESKSARRILAMWMVTGYRTTNIKNHIFGAFQKKYKNGQLTESYSMKNANVITEKVVSRDEVNGWISFIKGEYLMNKKEEFDFTGEEMLQYLKEGSYPYQKMSKVIRKISKDGNTLALHVSLINTTNYNEKYKPGDRIFKQLKKYKIRLDESLVEDFNDWPGRITGAMPQLIALDSASRQLLLEKKHVILGLIVSPCNFDALAHELVHYLDYLTNAKLGEAGVGDRAPFFDKLDAEELELEDPDYSLDSIVKSIRLRIDPSISLKYYFRDSEYETWLNDILDKVFIQSYEKKHKDSMKPLEYARQVAELIKPPAIFPNVSAADSAEYFEKLISEDSPLCYELGSSQEFSVLALWELTGYKTANIKSHLFGIFQKKYGHGDSLIERYADEVKRKGSI